MQDIVLLEYRISEIREKMMTATGADLASLHKEECMLQDQLTKAYLQAGSVHDAKHYQNNFATAHLCMCCDDLYYSSHTRAQNEVDICQDCKSYFPIIRKMKESWILKKAQ